MCHSIHKYLFSMYYVSRTLLGSRDIAMTITGKIFCLPCRHIPVFFIYILMSFNNYSYVYESVFLMNVERIGTMYVLLCWFLEMKRTSSCIKESEGTSKYIYSYVLRGYKKILDKIALKTNMSC